MDAVAMQAFINRVGEPHKIRDHAVRQQNVHRGKRFLLVEAPDVQFVDGFDAGDLPMRFSFLLPGVRNAEKLTSSRSCWMSLGSTPLGTLSSRIVPDFLTTHDVS